jgi:Cu(I)/Ag(I) efflux system membrane fusion protein
LFAPAGIAVLVVAVAAAFGMGMFVQWAISPATSPGTVEPVAGGHVEYTCPMHPQIRLTDPDALCPICNMKLVAVESAATDTSSSSFSDTAVKLMEIETVPVEARAVSAIVRMVGKIDYDETRVATITAWVPGRLDRLFVDYTGMPVQKGYHMVELYSPELLTAQEEVIVTAQAVAELEETDSEYVRQAAITNAQAAYEKLRLLGLSKQQIDAIIATGTTQNRITINSPVSGIVTERFATQGQYVKTGSRIYAIADLSEVWVRLDAYESDLQWLRYGQEVRFTTRAYPGETFTGRVAFIAPTLDEKTRTVRVRVNAANAEGKLMPGMFAQAEITAGVSAGGKVMDVSLADKWMCPMHPAVIKDAEGSCDICGMPLERPESLGYAGVDADDDKPLVVPDSAVLRTGKRAVVYVAEATDDGPTFELRQVVLGPRVGPYYIIREGLQAGERVVAKGAFKIDSERQLQGLPSMMSPVNNVVETPEAPPTPPSPAPAALPEAFAQSVAPLFEGYFALQAALAGDELADALGATKQMAEALQTVDGASLDEQAQAHWQARRDTMAKALADAVAAKDINTIRVEFHVISRQLIAMVQDDGLAAEQTLYLIRCPMAFDNAGAAWLQTDGAIRNPYYGAMMLRCGVLLETIEPAEHQHDDHD